MMKGGVVWLKVSKNNNEESDSDMIPLWEEAVRVIFTIIEIGMKIPSHLMMNVYGKNLLDMSRLLCTKTKKDM